MNSKKPLKGPEAEKYIEKSLGFPLSLLERFPKYFLMETINVCNARCVMCGIDFDSKEKAVIADDLFDKITEEVFGHKDHVEKVMLYLDGEPLLDKKIHLKIKKMKDAGIKNVNIATNASLLDDQKAEQLINAGLDQVYITLDSMKKDVYEAIRIGLKFEKVYENIKGFISIRNKLNPKLSIRIQMILQENNYTEADDFKSYWTGILNNNDQVAVQKSHNWGSAVDVMKYGDENRVNHIPCIALWGTFVFHLNGDVPLCCMDTNDKVLLGNLTTQSIAEIWKGERLREIRKKHIDGKRNEITICDGCTLWRESKRVIEHPADVDCQYV